MPSSLSYNVFTKDGERQDYDITTVIDGLSAISYGCNSLLYRTLEFEIDSKFRTVWDDRD
jgi:hypothetical protein